MREEKRRLIKLSRRVGPRTLRKAVERYLEWEIFGYWVRTALESGCPLPASVEGAVRQRCPNFLEADAAAHAANPEEEPHCRFNRMIKWVEDHEFTDAKTRGWFDVLLHRRVCIRVTPESSITGATGKRNGRELPPLNTRLSRLGKSRRPLYLRAGRQIAICEALRFEVAGTGGTTIDVLTSCVYGVRSLK